MGGKFWVKVSKINGLLISAFYSGLLDWIRLILKELSPFVFFSIRKMKKMPLTIKTDYVTRGRRDMDQHGQIQGERISFSHFFLSWCWSEGSRLRGQESSFSLILELLVIYAKRQLLYLISQIDISSFFVKWMINFHRKSFKTLTPNGGGKWLILHIINMF